MNWLSYSVIVSASTYSHADTGDVIASHLPKLKNLRKVEVENVNPMPILLSARLCGKLDEVIISCPKHCKVCFRNLSCPGTHSTSGCPGTLLCTPFMVYVRRSDPPPFSDCGQNVCLL